MKTKPDGWIQPTKPTFTNYRTVMDNGSREFHVPTCLIHPDTVDKVREFLTEFMEVDGLPHWTKDAAELLKLLPEVEE